MNRRFFLNQRTAVTFEKVTWEKLHKLKAINMREAAEAAATGLAPEQAERPWPGPLCSVLVWLYLWRVSPKQ